MSAETILSVVTSDQGSRVMPDFVKKGLIVVNGGESYLKAAYRVLWLREEHPDWSIVTSVVYADYEKGFVVMQATVMDASGRVLATAHSEESRGKLPYVKKAEMGAIARALGLCGYGTQFGEMDEDRDENSMADSPQIRNTPKTAPSAKVAPVAPPKIMKAKDYRDDFIADAITLGIPAETIAPKDLSQWAMTITQMIDQTPEKAWQNSVMWYQASETLRKFHQAQPGATMKEIEVACTQFQSVTQICHMVAAEWHVLAVEGLQVKPNPVPATHEAPALTMTDTTTNPPADNPNASTLAAILG